MSKSEQISELGRRSAKYAKIAAAYARYGRPNMVMAFEAGIGDEFLCSGVIRELRARGLNKIWMAARYPELFQNNNDIDAVVPFIKTPFILGLLQRLEIRVELPFYGFDSTVIGYTGSGEEMQITQMEPCQILTTMCRSAGITGEVTVKPVYVIQESEKKRGKIVTNQICIMSTGATPEKTWYADRYQKVVDALSKHYNFVQLGIATDPKLDGVTDLRGKTNLRQTAAILSQSLVFVGQEGFLMHLARAVDCRSVIVYGGRLRPTQSGYSCNENVTSSIACSPCGRDWCCEFDVECMKMIAPSQVISAIERQVQRVGCDLAIDKEIIEPLEATNMSPLLLSSSEYK